MKKLKTSFCVFVNQTQQLLNFFSCCVFFVTSLKSLNGKIKKIDSKNKWLLTSDQQSFHVVSNRNFIIILSFCLHEKFDDYKSFVSI